jgi:hypothetical protein
MLILTKNILATLLVVMTLISCRQNQVDGIIIDHTLYESLSFSKKQELRQLILQTLKKNDKSLAKLNNYWCGGAAGCYDLGFIVTQIIYRLGEKDFMTMVDKLDSKETLGLEGLIAVGLEYGDNDKDSKMDNKRIENEFPELKKLLKSKLENKLK